jgi:hypothetical protein
MYFSCEGVTTKEAILHNSMIDAKNLMIFKLYLCHAYNDKSPKPTWYWNDDATIHCNNVYFS